MGKLLEKIISPLRTFVVAATITAAVAGMPNEAYAKSVRDYEPWTTAMRISSAIRKESITKEDPKEIKTYTGPTKGTYEYFTQSRNITTSHLVSAPEKGLSGSSRYGEIKSIGNYQESSQAPRNAENIEIEIEQKNNELRVGYFCQPKRFNERLPVYEQMFREDPVNTHVYFLLPEHVTLLRETQMLKGISNRTMNPATHIGTPFEDTKLCEAIKNINIATEEGAKPRDCDTKELERAYDNTANAIGRGIGTGLKVMKSGMKWTLNRAEKKRIRKIKETYGEDYQIHKMPFHQIDGPVFKYTYFGRFVSLFLDTSKVIEGDKTYIVIPQISFTQDIAGTTRRATLENLAYEVPLERIILKSRQEIEKENLIKKLFAKYSDEEKRNILDGEWKTLDGEKIIEIDFERGRNYLRRWRDWSIKGTYEEKWENKRAMPPKEKEWNKKFMIIHDKSVNNSSEYKLFLDNINPNWATRGPTRTKTFDVILPSMIYESYPGRYLIKKNVKVERLHSLEQLIGVWKTPQQNTESSNNFNRRGTKNPIIVVFEDNEAYFERGGNREREKVDSVAKANQLYFLSQGDIIFKIDNNTILLHRDKEKYQLIRASSSQQDIILKELESIKKTIPLQSKNQINYFPKKKYIQRKYLQKKKEIPRPKKREIIEFEVDENGYVRPKRKN